MFLIFFYNDNDIFDSGVDLLAFSHNPLIEDLKGKTGVSDTQLDTDIIGDLYILAGCFDNYYMYIDRLQLTVSDQADVKNIEWRHNHQSAMQKALMIFKRQLQIPATYRVLLNIVLSLGKKDVAQKICEYICKFTFIHNLTSLSTP